MNPVIGGYRRVLDFPGTHIESAVLLFAVRNDHGGMTPTGLAPCKGNVSVWLRREMGGRDEESYSWTHQRKVKDLFVRIYFMEKHRVRAAFKRMQVQFGCTPPPPPDSPPSADAGA